jgi:hypothetical protein
MTKDSSLLLHAIHSLSTGGFLKKPDSSLDGILEQSRFLGLHSSLLRLKFSTLIFSVLKNAIKEYTRVFSFLGSLMCV